ncbi:MAG TPA: hypothetical protein VFO01_08180 [Trebonia sp.]|nr:hypothetical protein [Trebonia sp.]
MTAGMVPWTGSAPRRARHLIPRGLPRRGELVAGCAVALVVAHLLLAQLTLVLAVAFAVVSKASRWRLWWLLAPAAAGLTWALAIGPGRALAGSAAGPASILWHLGGGHLAGEAGHPFAGFGDIRGWLPGQFPVALVAAAAEAAIAGWLDWLHTDEWAVPPPRPGLIAAARRGLGVSGLRSGAVVTRDGCALGVAASTGATAELRWAELARGALVAGCAQQDVTLTGLQVVHAALRRRKPVIVLDLGDAAVARAVAAACQATGTPLLAGGPAVDPGRAVRERLAALLPADRAELAGRACAGLAALAADLRRIGVDGDALVWVPRGELVPAQALAELLRGTCRAGVSVLIGTTSPGTAAELSGLTGTALIYRVADRDLAARLATRAGTWLLPASAAATPAGQRPDAAPGQHLAPSPVIPARSLLALAPAEFVLAVSEPRQRVIALGRLVPARLPGTRP